MAPTYTTLYTGFYGQIDLASPEVPNIVCWKLGVPETAFSGANAAIQWTHEKGEALQTTTGFLFLAGLVWSPLPSLKNLAQILARSILTGRYQDLATVSENAAGCLLTESSLFLWVGFASSDHVFFRLDEQRFTWSTNPLDLVRFEDDVDPWQIRRCCHGDDAFIYKTERIQRVKQGHLVRLRLHVPGQAIEETEFDRFLPDQSLASRTLTIERVVQLTREALHRSVKPLACGEPVGLMLSGGSGSTTLLRTMKEAHVNVIAYHIEAQMREASEYRFAREASTSLDVPLVSIPMSCGADYLRKDWLFPHPDGHPWARWHEQIAARARQDGVRLLISGAGDDHAFGPEMEYGLHSILFARILWGEKWRMMRELILSTNWNIYDVLKSIWPGRQLIGLTYLAGPSREDRQMRRADFLTPLPVGSQREIDAALLHSPCFTPQGVAVELTLLQPQGIRLYYPYYHRAIQALSLALPAAYRLMPTASLPPRLANQMETSERIVDKPILRLACDGPPLPGKVVWRTWGIAACAPIQTFCLDHTQMLWDILAQNSYLTQMNILDVARLKEVLASRTRIRDNYTSLIASALVEIFLGKAFREQCKRGGPLWG